MYNSTLFTQLESNVYCDESRRLTFINLLNKTLNRSFSYSLFYYILKGGEQETATAPPGRRGTRSTGATKSTAAEDFASVLGEYASVSSPPRMVLSGL